MGRRRRTRTQRAIPKDQKRRRSILDEHALLDARGKPMLCLVRIGKAKVIYPTWDAAELARYKLMEHHGTAIESTYSCQFGDHFHHTSVVSPSTGRASRTR
jgi:hypothetical protein